MSGKEDKVDVPKDTLADDNTPENVTENTTENIEEDAESVDSFGSDEVAREQSKYKEDKIEDIEALAQEMEECYLEAVEEMKELEKFAPRFKALNEKTDKLFRYYFGGPWMSHRERIYSEGKSSYGICGEDLIFDFYGDIHNLAKKNLKEMTLYLTDKKEYR